MADYFVDAINGNDLNSGADWANAWKTLDKVLTVNAGASTYYFSDGVYMPVTKLDHNLAKNMTFVGVGAVVFQNPLSGDLYKDIHDVGSYETVYSVFRNINFVNPNRWITEKGSTSSLRSNMWFFYNCSFSGELVEAIGENRSSMRGLKFHGCITEGSWKFPVISQVITDTTSDCIVAVAAGVSVTISSSAYLYTLLANNEEGGLANASGVVTKNTPTNFEPVIGAHTIFPQQYQSSVTTGFEYFPGSAMKTMDDTSGNPYFPASTLGWIQESGSPGALDIDDVNGITVNTGTGSVALSPVFYYPNGIVLKGISMDAIEFSEGGLAQVIDSTPSNSIRSVEYRLANSPFNQDDVTPAWVELTRKSLTSDSGKYLQFRLTFHQDATQ